MGKLLVISQVPKQLSSLRRALEKADSPEQAIDISAASAGIEEAMKRSGIYRTEEIRPVRELFLDARCELGGMLRKALRAPRGDNRKKTKERAAPSFNDELKRLNLEKKRAIEAQRASCLPVSSRNKVYAEAKQQEVLPTLSWLIDEARPYWYADSRKTKHRNIAGRARLQQEPDSFGPFPLLYADPAWTFNTYSDMGLEKTPTQHYPTMTDEQIIALKIYGKTVNELASDDAALLMWCTSSNIQRALDVMEAWDFEYKTHAVWVKTKDDGHTPISGMGLVFRNMHEILLYGTRGKMPGPQYQPPSAFFYPRGRHSAKPPEIRTAIEKMYPDFDEGTRLELFSRDSVPGWTHFGFEANKEAAQ